MGRHHSVLLDEGLDANGLNITYPRNRITLYAFRHYALQRHADAGTPVDVLRQLMDHVSVETTLGYYKVTLKRRREAVATVSDLMLDRHGRRVGRSATSTTPSVLSPSPTATVRSRPTSKPAAGTAPIRVQCAGRLFYRPDPLDPPAIQTHLAELRVNKEQLATDAAGWVITPTSPIRSTRSPASPAPCPPSSMTYRRRTVSASNRQPRSLRRIRQADNAMQGGDQ